MARYVLEVMYDGTCFHGSQIQGATPTVQLAVNNTLGTLLRRPVATVGASRTDEGVHALTNFYHFDLDAELTPDFLYKCNAILPRGLALKKVFRATSDDFNARFDALSRAYRYRIYAVKNPFLANRALFYPFPLNFELLASTADIIKTHSEFESFAKRNMQSKTFVCNISESYWEKNGDELHYVVSANRFLRGMVRGLVATQLQIAKENKGPAAFTAIIEAKDCTKARFNVAGYGLYLESINYPAGVLDLVLSQ